MNLDTDKEPIVLMCINQPEILGVTSEENILINRCLTNKEKKNTINILNSALRSGYDSCIVTRTGAYATKRL